MTTPQNRRFSVSGHIPSPSVRSSSDRRMSIEGGPPKPSGRPPRKSMIPRVGRDRTNHSPDNSVSSSRAGSKSISSHRQSISGRQSIAPKAPLPDTRPINDKSFQTTCVKQLLGFLQSRGYEYPVTFKSLTRPSSKDFTNICTFMLRYFDKDFGKGNLRFEDEVAMNFKYLGYPFNISKTALVAAGSPHTWPTLLAGLTWLMETIQIADAHVTPNELESATSFESMQELEVKTDKAFFQYLGLSYQAYMKGDAEARDKLETDLLNRFEKDDAYIDQAKERMTDLNATILERIHEISERSSDLPEMLKKRAAYQTDLEQFHDLIRQMDDHKNALRQKVEERTAELATTNRKLDKITTCINDLSRAVQEQEFNMADIHKLESELKGLSEATDRVYEQRDQHQKILEKLEQELLAATNTLSALVDSYNQKRCQIDSDFPKINFNSENVLDNFVLGIDIQELYESAKSQHLDCIEQVESTKKAYQDALDSLTRREDEYQESDAKLQIVLDKIAKFESSMQSEQKAHEATLEIRKREVALVEEKITSLRDPVALEEQMAAYERQCAELEALRRDHSEKNIQLRKAVTQEIQKACEKMAEHDNDAMEQLKVVQQYWEDARGIIDSM